MKKIIIIPLILFACITYSQAPTCPSNTVREQIQTIANTISGTVGVSALHLEKNEALDYNATLQFPMASTYKIPIAIHTLMLIEHGAYNLDDTITLTPCDLRQDSNTINTKFIKGQTSFTLHELLIAMMQTSDNTATDALLNLYGNSPSHITNYLHESGVNNISVNRSVHDMIVDFYSMPHNTSCDAIIDFEKHADRDDLPQPRETEERFYNDLTRDIATPCAMTELLTSFFTEHYVTKPMVSLLMHIMEGCKTGNARIKGLLPTNYTVAHKTGTIAGISNDAGIITLPNGEHIILTIFINGSTSTKQERDNVIAKIARLIVDYFSKDRFVQAAI